MARRFQHDGVTWEVELSGPGTIGCSVRRVEVTFKNPSTGAAIPGRVSMVGDGRLADEHLVSALVEALDDAPSTVDQSSADRSPADERSR
jgi:hypothetical protein